MSRAELDYIQPFGHDVCATWRDALHGSEVPMNEGALQSLRVLEAEGRVTLLNAPRAGHGKTHLLGRVARRLQEDAIVAGLPWLSLEGLTWTGTGLGILQDLAKAGARPTQLQKVGGGLLATLLRRLIQTGRIPSTDPVQAMRVLSQDPMQLFMEGGSAGVIGAWFRRHFDQLAKPLAESSGLDGTDAVEGWLRGFFNYLEDPSSATLAALERRMEKNSAVEMARLVRLITTWKPLVLVADHMDGLYRDPEAGVAIARMSLALVSMSGVHVVLSMNQDLWETTFGGQLPSALEDRLNACSVPLRGPTVKEAQDLVFMRLDDAGVSEVHSRSFVSFLDLERFFIGRAVGSVSARGLLRHAAQAWRHWLKSGAPIIPPRRPEEPEIPPGSFLLEDAEALGIAPAPSGGGYAPAPPSRPERPPEAFPSFLDESGEGDDDNEDELKALAAHLAQDAGGRVVDLSSGPGTLAPVGKSPPPSVVNFIPVARSAQESPPTERQNPAVQPPPLPPRNLEAAASPEESPASLHEGVDQGADSHHAGMETGEAESAEVQRARQSTPIRIRPAGSMSPTQTDIFAPSLPPSASQGVYSNGHGSVSSSDTAAHTDAQLRDRFEEARQEASRSGRTAQMELPVLSDLVRLAGKRFPVVNFDEIELPGLLGRSLPRWSMQGMELIFAIEEFTDTRYWKTVSTYVAGRLAELQVQAAQSGEQPSQLKLIVFKSDLEGPGLNTLLQNEVIPSSLRSLIDAVHLDARSLASLYAMHQLVRDTETGSLQADANAVLGTLANELDFLWKRLTRPKMSPE